MLIKICGSNMRQPDQCDMALLQCLWQSIGQHCAAVWQRFCLTLQCAKGKPPLVLMWWPRWRQAVKRSVSHARWTANAPFDKETVLIWWAWGRLVGPYLRGPLNLHFMWLGWVLWAQLRGWFPGHLWVGHWRSVLWRLLLWWAHQIIACGWLG